MLDFWVKCNILLARSSQIIRYSRIYSVRVYTEVSIFYYCWWKTLRFVFTKKILFDNTLNGINKIIFSFSIYSHYFYAVLCTYTSVLCTHEGKKEIKTPYNKLWKEDIGVCVFISFLLVIHIRTYSEQSAVRSLRYHTFNNK